MLIGAHVSTAGGLNRALERGRELECRAIQVFNQSPRMWRPTAYDEADFSAFRAAVEQTGIDAVLIHAVYLLNTASEDAAILEKTHASLVQSLTVGAGIGACGVVLHAGSALKGDPAAAVRRAGAAIARALDETAEGGCDLHLENTAGAGGTLGRSFAELAELIEAAGGGERIGVCLDSCHLLASGYDVRSAEGLADVIDEFDRVVGLDRLRSLHLNDSQTGLGSNRDRHARLGTGELGEDGCAAFLAEPRFERLPCVLETPDLDKPEIGRREVALAGELRRRGQGGR